MTERMVCRTSGDGDVALVVLGRVLWGAALLLAVGTMSGEAGTTLLVESLWWNGDHHSGALAEQLLWNGDGLLEGWLLNGGGCLWDLGKHSLFGIGPYEHRVHLAEEHRQHHGL